MEAVEKDVMDRKPKPKNEGIFAHGLGLRIALQGRDVRCADAGWFLARGTLDGFRGRRTHPGIFVLALSQVVQSYNMRSDHSLFAIGPFTNRRLNMAALLSVVLVLVVALTPLRIPFGLVSVAAEAVSDRTRLGAGAASW